MLHHHDELAVEVGHVVDRHDVRVMNPRGEACLVEEHRDEDGIVDEMGVRHLQSDRAREAGRPLQPGQVHARHAAARDVGNDTIATESPPSTDHDRRLPWRTVPT